MNDLAASTRALLQTPPGAADPFAAALLAWLAGYAENTRRAYARAVRDFFSTVLRHPSAVDALAVASWKVQMNSRGLSAATIAQRMSALSAYFHYLATTPGTQADGSSAPLLAANPVTGVGRRDLARSPYGHARKVSAAQLREILRQVDETTVRGARDYAMFLFYVLCARRRTEVVSLRGRDLRLDGHKVSYRVRLKGGAEKWKELPPPVWDALHHYLELAERVLSDDSPLFVSSTRDSERPLSAQAVENALRRYAARAGLEPKSLTLHSLRHLGAALFQDASGDVRQTQMFLDHAQLNTTQVYLDALQGDPHRHWQAMLKRISS